MLTELRNQKILQSNKKRKEKGIKKSPLRLPTLFNKLKGHLMKERKKKTNVKTIEVKERRCGTRRQRGGKRIS